MTELILVSKESRELIEQIGTWGNFTANYSAPDQIGLVVAVSEKEEPPISSAISEKKHFMNFADPTLHGRWFRGTAQLGWLWLQVRARVGCEVTAQALADNLPSGFLHVGEEVSYVVIVHVPNRTPDEISAGVPEWTAWKISGSHALAIEIDVELANTGMSQLNAAWPVATLAEARVVLVGLGSIGSSAARELVRYGIRKFTLVDWDRLEWHNLVRHQATRKDVGRYKVDAIAEILKQLSPDCDVRTERVSAVTSANRMREIFANAELVIGATDGVTSRRTLSHLARQARISAVVGCVIEDGALGEVIRLRPWADHGCLQCRRDAMSRIGAFDPEPDIDRPYGTGDTHQPMTAVGADLDLIGGLVAKVAVATLLEAAGHPDQRLPGEQMLIGLRPSKVWAPPYDVSRAGEVKWLPAYPPEPDCPTCFP